MSIVFMSAAATPTYMTTQQLSELTQSQRDRLAFIELRLRFVGEFRRQDLVSRFGIQTAAATRDLARMFHKPSDPAEL